LDALLAEFIATAPAGFERRGVTRSERWAVGAAAAAALDARFEALALELFAHQAERVPVYRAYAALALGGATPQAAAAVPPLPVEAFREARVAGFPPAAQRLAFHTSGTSGARPGVLALDDPALYERSLERAFQHHVVPDRDTIRILVVAAAPAAAPHSSLSFMFHHVRQRFGAARSETVWAAGGVRWRALGAALQDACARGEPVCLLGTAFTWVHVADTCDAEGFRVELPAGSRLLETGGYKGRSRTLSRADLLALVERSFGIPASHVVGEYGMTEMGSQFYTTSLRAAVLGTPLDDVWSHPAWLRPRIVDSESGEVRELESARELGLLAHHDLANRGTVAHLLTADLGRPRAGGFDLAGRAPRAEPRGCGLGDDAAGSRS
jgi:hypothetical protein